ncbi:MAG: helix-turn-helix domain-containing protein [Clostridiales bacterium]|jgi:GNAT superfamily N-acetyltransferase|nr:helix-turn-helix domain-containing protein [Clostridiales bacterium]
MQARNNKLLLFNSMMLLNKREVLESFDYFVNHHRQMNNEEGYSEGKRKVLLILCDEFRKKIEISDIPSITKPWLFYEYSITNDSIALSLNKCYEIEFDDEDEMSTMSSSEEYMLVEAKCDYLNVEQYAKLYDVTTTAVRQWIRRGKLRTAVKNGRDWLIPALADKPKRGFESVTYSWNMLSDEIINNFPFLADTECVYIYQDRVDKKIFYAITGWSDSDNQKKIAMKTEEREQLELMLIALPGVQVEDMSAGISYVPSKRNFSFPILSYYDDKMMSSTFIYESIVVKQGNESITWFSPNNKPNNSSSYDYTSTYLVAVNWEFWGVPTDCENVLLNAIDSGDFSNCAKIATLSGYLILCKQMIENGYNPLAVCDGESAALEYVMSALTGEGGPLNESDAEPMQDIFYIEELEIEETLRRRKLGSRILQELPSVCLELLHIMPDIIAYYPSPAMQDLRQDSEKETALRSYSGFSYPENLKDINVIAFYQKNGFQELGNSRLMYAYTEK